MNVFFAFLGVLVLPILINKTTERGRFDFVHPYLREMWMALLLLFTWWYVLESSTVKKSVMSTQARYANHPVATYGVVAVLGALLLMGYWFVTGWLLRETAASSPGNQEKVAVGDSVEATTKPAPALQAEVHRAPSVTKNPEDTSPKSQPPRITVQQHSSGADSPNVATFGNNSPVTITRKPNPHVAVVLVRL